MKKIDLGQTLSILANLGVIAGIVFLAIEVRQNQESLEQSNLIDRAAVLTDTTAHFAEFRYVISQDEEITDLWYRGRRGEELSLIETDRFNDLCSSYFCNLATAHERFVLLGEESLAASGPAAYARSEMQVSDRLRDCWLPSIEIARGWGYGSIAEALAEEIED